MSLSRKQMEDHEIWGGGVISDSRRLSVTLETTNEKAVSAEVYMYTINNWHFCY